VHCAMAARATQALAQFDLNGTSCRAGKCYSDDLVNGRTPRARPAVRDLRVDQHHAQRPACLRRNRESWPDERWLQLRRRGWTWIPGPVRHPQRAAPSSRRAAARDAVLIGEMNVKLQRPWPKPHLSRSGRKSHASTVPITPDPRARFQQYLQFPGARSRTPAVELPVTSNAFYVAVQWARYDFL